MYTSITSCRSCRQENLTPILDLGISPIADGLLTKDQLQQQELKFPLSVVFCPKCSLMQIRETVSPEVLFCNDYPYFSSFSDELLRHSKQNVHDLIKRRRLGKTSFVVELASNDGYLLKNYVNEGVPCLGIDPAEGPAKAAEKIGVKTLCTFFNNDFARQFAGERGKADVVHANNVLAHVADTNGFVDGISAILKGDGVAVIEVPYVQDLIDHNEFDTIYHQHLCYFSVTSANHLFRRHSLFVNDIKRLSIHGGSIRLYIEKKEAVTDQVKSLLDHEQKLGIDKFEYYSDFATKVSEINKSILDLMVEIKSRGSRIAAYGAAAKGCTLINMVGIGPDLIEYVVDRNIHKHGKYMPGMHIPIYPTERLMSDKPDYVLLLAWNFADEIMSQQKAYIEQGGRFIIPIPEPTIV